MDKNVDCDEFALDVLLMMMLMLMMILLIMMLLLMMMPTRKLQLLFTERTAAGRTQQTISNVVQPE